MIFIFNLVPVGVLLRLGLVVILGVSLVSGLEHNSVVKFLLLSLSHCLVVVNVFFFCLFGISLLLFEESVLILNSIVESFGVMLIRVRVIPVS